MRHRRDTGRIACFELIDHGHDARKLGRDVRYFGGRNLEASESAKALYIFRSEHGILAGIRKVIDFSLDNTHRLWIGLPVATVAPRFPLAALGLNVKELSRLFLERHVHRSRYGQYPDLCPG